MNDSEKIWFSKRPLDERILHSVKLHMHLNYNAAFTRPKRIVKLLNELSWEWRPRPLSPTPPCRPRPLSPTPPVAHAPCRPRPLSPTPPVAHAPCRPRPLSPTPPVAHAPCRPRPLSPTPPVAHAPCRVLIHLDATVEYNFMKSLEKMK